MYKQGDIHLAKLYPPVLILQTDMLNDIGHTTVIVLPLSTILIEDSYPLRYRINKRDKLLKTSEILCDQIRSIDVNRIDTEVITSLTMQELILIEEQIQIILGINV